MSASPEGMDEFLKLEFAAENSDYDHYHPDFRDAIQRLNFVESYESQEWHKICAFGQHQDDPHYAYCLLHYTRINYESFNNTDITPNDAYRMDHIYGISLSIADIHYQSGHYASCLMELDRIENAMRMTNHELLEDVRCLQYHCRNFLGQIPVDGTRTDVGYAYFPQFP